MWHIFFLMYLFWYKYSSASAPDRFTKLWKIYWPLALTSDSVLTPELTNLIDEDDAGLDFDSQ